MYHIVWEFIAKEGHEEKFLIAYGSEGEWVKLFRGGEGYVSTHLLRDVGSKRRFITIDEWKSKSAYSAFRVSHSKEYQRLDAKCSVLTEYEALVGSFEPADDQ